METSTVKSPPTGRVMEVLATLADSPGGRTSAELAKICGISTSTCALVLAELERGAWVTRREDRRFCLGSGLFALSIGAKNLTVTERNVSVARVGAPDVRAERTARAGAVVPEVAEVIFVRERRLGLLWAAHQR